MPRFLFVFLPALLTAAPTLADEPKPMVKPLRALLVVGGCCHDYDTQKLIISEGTAARAHIEWSIVHQGGTTTNAKIPLYEKEDWSAGYDIVVHNECFSNVPDPKWTSRIVKPHREGLPAVVIHCAMHCYRDGTDEWFKFVGVTSRRHGSHFPFEVVPADSKHPILSKFPVKWPTPAGELYWIEKAGEKCKPLAHAYSKETKKNEVCVWTNEFGKGRVFGTTIGHYNQEMADPVFLDMLTRGILWACDKPPEQYLKAFDASKQKFRWEVKPKPPETSEPPMASPAQVPENLARGKAAKASSEQDDSRSASKGNDGQLRTRWCATGPRPNEWWQVDLGKEEEVVGCKVVWEFGGRSYRYRVEGSGDGTMWSMLVDQTGGMLTTQSQSHAFAARKVRHVRVTITGLPNGSWPSFWEFEVHGKKMVKPAPAAPMSKPGLENVKVAPGFDLTLFAAPPEIAYPTCVCATPDGTVFVGVDLNGSLGARPGQGRIVRCRDLDNDGKADRFDTFAKVDSPRGLWFDHQTLYVLHPPLITAFHDLDNDGVADRSEVLVSGLGFDLKFRGADHTTNGFRMGIDGWLYIALGDYGCRKAVGKDGATVSHRGGGVVRVRPDGSGLELVADGLRNIYDVAVSPTLDLFTRDNTNDGGGWNVRLSHVIPTGHYGYPTLFKNFASDLVPPLMDSGGGSPCGVLFLDEPTLPEPWRQGLLTCEWGRSEVNRHPLTPHGAGWKAGQETFLQIPRPTDIDVDASGRLYVASWQDGGFDFSRPDVGYVVRVTPTGWKPRAVPDFATLDEKSLLAQLTGLSAACRLAAQRELLRRPGAAGLPVRLEKLAETATTPAAQAAAIFTLGQLRGDAPLESLTRLAKHDHLREFALKALADDRRRAGSVSTEPFATALQYGDPRVRLQAVIGLGRLGFSELAARLVPLTSDKDPLVAHAAVNAMVRLGGVEPCLKAVTAPGGLAVAGALKVLAQIHQPNVVDGLISMVNSNQVTDPKPILMALMLLYHREADWDGKWWGTRPDTRGPYYQPVTWSESEKIGAVLRSKVSVDQPESLAWFVRELHRHRIEMPDLMSRFLEKARQDADARRLAVEIFADQGSIPEAMMELLAMTAESAGESPALRAKALRALTALPDQAAARPLIFRVLAEAKTAGPLNSAWVEYATDGRHINQLKEFVRLSQSGSAAQRELALGVLAATADRPLGAAKMRAAAEAAVTAAWKRDDSLVLLIQAVTRLGLTGYAPQLRSLAAHKDPAVSAAARKAIATLRVDGANAGPLIGQLSPDTAIRETLKLPGDIALGARLFSRQGCINCHTTTPGETLKGPLLAGISARYQRPELLESIIKPSAKIAQGFESNVFTLVNGKMLVGFVVREAASEVEIRDANGTAFVIKKDNIEERRTDKTSVMPEKLVDNLTTRELASVLAYLESIKGK